MIGSDEVVLQCCGERLRIPAASGKTYRVVARSASDCEAVVGDALRSASVEIVPAFGGLRNGLSVLENILLPAIYHPMVPAKAFLRSLLGVLLIDVLILLVLIQESGWT